MSNNEQNKGKIIIGGCPRSGTGALARLLNGDGRAVVTQERGFTGWKRLYNIKTVKDKERVLYVGDKMPEGYLMAARKLYNTYPNAKFMFTNRNGYGVVSSYLRRPLRTKSHKEISKQSVIKRIKNRQTIWINNYKRIKELPKIFPADGYLLLRYEDNCADIDGLLVKLAKFLRYDSPVENESYAPTHLNWSEDIKFWEELVLSNVSKEFKDLVEEYEYERQNT